MRKALVLLVLVFCGSCAPRQGPARKTQGAALAKSVQQTRYVDDANTAGWTGSDVCAQEQSAEADLPVFGGDVDMRGLHSATLYNCLGTWTIGATKPVRLWLPNQLIVVTASGSNPCITVTSNGTFMIGYNPSEQYLPGGSSRLQCGGAGTNDGLKWWASYGGMQDVAILAAGAQTAFHVVNSAGSGTFNNNFRNVTVACGSGVSGAIGVEVTAATASLLATGNVFNPITAIQCDRSAKLDTSNNQGPTNNTFQFYFTTTVAGTACIDVQSGSSNVFMNGECEGSPYATGFNVASGATANGLIGSRIEGSTISVNDAGTGTTYLGDSFTDCSTNIFAPSAVLLGGWSNTNCNFDQLPRGLSVGSQGLRVNGGTALTGTSQAQGTIVTSLNGANAVPSGTMQYQFGCSGTATSSTTLFLQPGGNQGTNNCNVTAGNTFVIVPVAGNISNLFCEAGTAGKAAGSGQVTIQRARPATSGFSNTSISCTIGKGQTCKDTSHSQAFSAGDALRVAVVTQGSETLADLHCAAAQQ